MTNLLHEIEAFCRRQKMSESQFGVEALKDKNFVPQLREGRDVRMSTVLKVQAFMAKNRPQAAA